MTLALSLAAIRRHPFSVVLSALLVTAYASVLGTGIPLALAAWAAAAVLGFELWYALEPFVLRRIGGYRDPSHAERELLDTFVGTSQLRPLVAVRQGVSLARGLRCLVVTRHTLELFEARALSGLLVQATTPIHGADVAGVVLVWLGNLPMLAAWWITRGCLLLGRLLSVVVGESLVLPLVVCPNGFLRWSGRVLGLTIVGLLGAMLMTDGFVAPGLALLTAWALVPAMRALVGWESQRVERAADHSTIEAGYGPQLLEALELLIVAEPVFKLTGVLGLLCRPGVALTVRADHLRQVLRQP